MIFSLKLPCFADVHFRASPHKGGETTNDEQVIVFQGFHTDSDLKGICPIF